MVRGRIFSSEAHSELLGLAMVRRSSFINGEGGGHSSATLPMSGERGAFGGEEESWLGLSSVSTEASLLK